MDSSLAGDWAGSNSALESCLRQLEQRPDFKLGEESGAFFLDQKFKTYTGDPEELVFLHSLGMVNYAMQAQVDEALVEARRSDQLQRWLQDEGKARADDPLARLLAAGLYGDQGQVDDARIDLERAREAYKRLGQPEPSFLGAELRRLALRHPAQAGSGAVWVLAYSGRMVQMGHGIVPEDAAQGLSVAVDGEEAQPLELAEDLVPGMEQALRDRQAGDALRNTGRVMLRVVAVAAIVFLGGAQTMSTADADLISGGVQEEKRHWFNLPAQVLALRLSLKPGPHRLRLRAQVNGQACELSARIRVPAGRTTLLQASLQGLNDGIHLSPSLQP
jgi:hypothetical protein